ncbi:MAG: ABC transporter ATP-binding protein [Spirochaetia bacterium]
MLEITDIHAAYKHIPVFSSLSLFLSQKRRAAIIGRSGSGKSTLLKICAGLKPTVKGSVFFKGKPVLPGNPGIGIVLQDHGLFPWMTIRENLELGLRFRKMNQVQIQDTVQKAFSRFKITSIADQYPGKISGGEKQRAAIVRTLVTKPELVLLDEPLSSLDALTRDELSFFLLDTMRQGEHSVILVTHSIEEAVLIGEDIYALTPNASKPLHLLGENKRYWDKDYRETAEFHSMVKRIRNTFYKMDTKGAPGEQRV